MRIAVNAHLLAHTQSFRRAGVSHYIEQVLLHLSELDHENRYDIYTTRGLDGRALPLGPNFRVRPSLLPTINPRIRIPWEQLYAPLMLAAQRVDVYHGCLNVVPFACPTASVVTIHDLAFLRFPQTFRGINRSYLDRATRLSASRAARILTVSEYTRREVVELLDVDPQRVYVTPNAARAHFQPASAEALAEFRQRRGLPERFILYVGTLEPRKNLTTLLDAYAALRRRLPDVPLIIGGGKGWLYEPVFQRMRELGLSQIDTQVRFVGYLPEEELPLWYAAATVFVFPSIYEGFGMPPLEAMACGTAVVVADASSLPEVVGDAGLRVPPLAADALTDALEQVICDDALRADLQQRGPLRARAFDWRATAATTLRAYREAAAERG